MYTGRKGRYRDGTIARVKDGWVEVTNSGWREGNTKAAINPIPEGLIAQGERNLILAFDTPGGLHRPVYC